MPGDWHSTVTATYLTTSLTSNVSHVSATPIGMVDTWLTSKVAYHSGGVRTLLWLAVKLVTIYADFSQCCIAWDADAVNGNGVSHIAYNTGSTYMRIDLYARTYGSADITCASHATTPVSAVWVPRLCKKYTRSKWACFCTSGYAMKYNVPRLCQTYICSEWACLYAPGEALKCISLMFPISTQNLHQGHQEFPAISDP